MPPGWRLGTHAWRAECAACVAPASEYRSRHPLGDLGGPKTMESATQPDATTPVNENGSANGAPAAEETFEVRRPVDGSVIREVRVDTPADVADTVARVRANQSAWEAIGFAGRKRWLEAMRDWILANQDRLDDLMQEETGKVRADSTLEAF